MDGSAVMGPLMSPPVDLQALYMRPPPERWFTDLSVAIQVSWRATTRTFLVNL